MIKESGFSLRSISLIILRLLLLFPSSLAHLDLFLSQAEMKRLTGFEGELWYVENGDVDRAAVEYEMEILSSIDELYFSWRNKAAIPISYFIDVKYEPGFTSSGKSVLSIPSNGTILPVHLLPGAAISGSRADVFSIRLPRCELSNEKEFYISIRFELDIPGSPNQTEFELIRKKRCLRSAAPTDFQEFDDNGNSEEKDLEQEFLYNRKELLPGANFFGSSTNVFYVSMGCLFGFVVIFSFVIIIYFTKADGRNSHCNGGNKYRDSDDVASSLIPPPSRIPVMASTPMDGQVASRNNYSRHSASWNDGERIRSSFNAKLDNRSSFNAMSNNRSLFSGKQSNRSSSPSTSSKCLNSASGFGVAAADETDERKSIQDEPVRISHSPEKKRELRVDEIVRELMVDKNDIQAERTVLEGTFGEVLVGRIRKNGIEKMRTEQTKRNDEDWMDVVIKRVKEKPSSQQIERFLSESLRFVCLPPHSNLCRPMAISSMDDESDVDEKGDHGFYSIRYVICYNHDGYGNLKKFLLRSRGADSQAVGAGQPTMFLSTQDLVFIALQIIRGLLHLHKFHILHRDMATRNCLVGRDLTIQICDTGLSRDLFPLDYHCLGDNENRPIKWLAYESLENSEFTTASEVWSFGVTLWELTTLAQQPYSDVDPFEMQAHLSADQRLSQPYNCPDELYLLMYCCWNLHTMARPTLDQLLSALEHFYTQLTQYI